MPDARRLEAEIAALQDALGVLGTAVDTLRLAMRHVARGAKEAAEPPLMPNYERAEEQLRTAINATSGAAKSVQRRLDMRKRAGAAPAHRRDAEAK